MIDYLVKRFYNDFFDALLANPINNYFLFPLAFNTDGKTFNNEINFRFASTPYVSHDSVTFFSKGMVHKKNDYTTA